MTPIIPSNELVPVPLTAEQAEREALAEKVFLALVQRGCPDTEASVRCFYLADLFIAERDQERSK